MTNAPELSVLRSICRTIVSRLQTDGRLAIVLIEAPVTGIDVPTHVHDEQDETFHEFCGSIRVNVGGRETLVCAGESTFGPRDVPRVLEICKRYDIRFVWSIARGRGRRGRAHAPRLTRSNTLPIGPAASRSKAAGS